IWLRTRATRPSSYGKASRVRMDGNMAWNWSPLKWISGDSNCETAATRGKAWNALCEAWPDSGPAPRFATPAHGRAEATRTTRAATYTGPCSPERQAQTD